MRKNLKIGFVLLVLLALAGFSQAQRIYIQPSSIVASPNSDFTVSIAAEGISNLYGFQFDVQYDGSVISFKNAGFSNALGTAGQVFCTDSSIWQINTGLASKFACVRMASGGVSVNGVLATLTLHADNAGFSQINLSNVALSDSSNQPITFAITNASVSTCGYAIACFGNSDCSVGSECDLPGTCDASCILPPDTQAPSVPAGLAAIAISQTQVNLSWTASTDNVGVAGYNIYRNSIMVSSSIATSYSDAGLTAGSAYNYAVSAFDAAGNESALSPIKSITMPTVSSIVAAYNFNENQGINLTDSSGNGFAGTISGARWVNGKYSKALSFNGINNYVQLNANDSFDNLTAGTITAWVKVSSTTLGFNDWFAADSGNCTNPFELAINNGAFEVRGAASGCTPTFDAYIALPKRQTNWHHLAYVVSVSGNKFYIDGVLVTPTYRVGSASTVFFFNNASAGATKYRIGNAVNNDSLAFKGSIDNLRVYRRALTAAEVKADMGSSTIVLSGASIFSAPTAFAVESAISTLRFSVILLALGMLAIVLFIGRMFIRSRSASTASKKKK
ncbi:MAG: LamG-like jellyroll fold domain-containing protein [Candidatus Diapherotrites archaeon]|nr:LamG-like jellyroll fold domain-containing protein [Candidatus Diapherotrites archaeon]